MSQLINRLVVSIGLLSGLFAVFVLSPPTNAVTGADWGAGNIMSDNVFFNPGSISTGDIQGFLNARMPTCNTWHARSGSANDSGPPYTCLKNYSENPTTHQNNGNAGGGGSVPGGWSAAQIIKHAADTYGVSPKVLIVLLQKEQSLITDDWPWAIQYRSATGYGCPDTAPCDAEYYGLYNQVMNAASQFKRYANNPGSYRYKAYQNNYIQYNPNTSCGGSNVYIANQATAGLYNYTPYQPNAAALNNLYGTGDGCSAYGNRNFWRLYIDWFGSTIGSRWESLLDPRVMITTGDTYKINPDTGAQLQSIPSNLQIRFSTKTNLNDQSGCLRTQFDTDRNVNACIRYSDLGEFTPTINNINPDGSPVLGRTSQWTCKIDYRTLGVTDQCFNSNTYISFTKKTTVAGVEYIITNFDSNNSNQRAFRSDRLHLLPNDSLLEDGEKELVNTSWTCKIDLDTKKIMSQCFSAGTMINFARKSIIDGEEYIITQHDNNRGNDFAFLAERFVNR